MSRGPTIVPVQPRLLGITSLCFYLGRSPQWFAEHRAALEREGFPRPDALFGAYDRHAVDIWLDQRSGLHAMTPEAVGKSWDKRQRTR